MPTMAPSPYSSRVGSRVRGSRGGGGGGVLPDFSFLAGHSCVGSRVRGSRGGGGGGESCLTFPSWLVIPVWGPVSGGPGGRESPA